LPNAEALVFDFNGTLFWDTEYNLRAWDFISRKYRGKPYTKEEVLLLNGRNSLETCRYFLGEDCPARRLQEIIEEKEDRYRKLCTEAGKPRLAPGAEQLIEQAYSRNLPIAIATGAPLSNLESYLKWFPSLSLFAGHILHDDGIRKGKPEPDIYLEAMRMLATRPEGTVVFEDSPPGVEAANRAGITHIYVAASPSAELETTAHMPHVLGVLSDFRQFHLPTGKSYPMVNEAIKATSNSQ